MSDLSQFRRWFGESSWQHSWPWPIWWALVAAIAMAALFVWHSRREGAELSKRSRMALLGLRIGACWLVIWMMFGWVRQLHRTEPAEVIIAVDDSASMAFQGDAWDDTALSRLKRFTASAESKQSRLEIALRLLNDSRLGWLQYLQRQYQVKVVLLGDSVRDLPVGDLVNQWRGMQANQPASKLGRGVQSLLDAQRGRPTAAVIVLTDGNNTEGPSIGDVADVARQRSIPLYLVGIGSDQSIRDVRLTDLLADDVAFIDDVVSISCQVHSQGFAGHKTTVRLLRTDTNELLAERDITLEEDGQPLTVDLSFQPPAAGDYSLTLIAGPMSDEPNTDNNRLVHQLSVHDAAIRILYVQAAPSYEYRFLSNLLSRSTNSAGKPIFELTSLLQEADQDPTGEDKRITALPLGDEIHQFDTIIFGDANPDYLGVAALNNLGSFVRERGGGMAILAGPRFTPMAYQHSALARLFPFDLSDVSAPEGPFTEPFSVELSPLGRLWPPCQIVADQQDNVRLWQSLPGLFWSVAIRELRPGARTILQHSTQSNESGQKLPIAVMHYVGAGKVLFHATDETYRWSRHEGQDEVYNRYWLQTLRYLSRSKLRGNHSPVEILVERSNFAEGEPIPFRVRFSQPGLVPVQDDGVRLMVEREGGRREQFVMHPETAVEGLFSGSATDLAPGSYRVWLGSPIVEPPPSPRTFRIVQPAAESTPQPMNSIDLKRAANRSGGQFFTLSDVDRLLSELPRGRRVRIETLPPQSKWNDPAIAAIFVLILTTHWILRRRLGLA